MTDPVRAPNLPTRSRADFLVALFHEGASLYTTARVALSSIAAAVWSTRGPSFATRALLYADLGYPEGTTAYVYGDATVAYRGVYLKAGAVNAGSWSIIGPLPEADLSALQAQIDTLWAALNGGGLPFTAWAPSTAYAFNQGVTNGGTAYIATTAHTSGSSFATDLGAGKWREVTDIETILADVEAARDDAESAADVATTATGIVELATVAAAEAATISSSRPYIRTAGYYAAGDGGGALYKHGGTAYTHDDITPAGGTHATLSDGEVFDVRKFGAKCDWDGSDGDATDDTDALQAAIDRAAEEFAGGHDLGGGAGGIVRLPARRSLLIGGPINIPMGVTLAGEGTVSSVLKIADDFTSGNCFTLGQTVGTAEICANQSKSGAGNLIMTTTPFYLPNGIGKVRIYANSYDESGRIFTVTGVDYLGNSIVRSHVGPAAAGASIDISSDEWQRVDSISVNGATAGNVSVSYTIYGNFSCRMQDLQIFAQPVSGIAAGAAMVYTSSAQHTGGIERVKMFAGGRSGFKCEVGWGGASYITCSDIEVYTHGDIAGNPCFHIDYAGDLIVPMKRIVMAGSAANNTVGIHLLGGAVSLDDIHAEFGVVYGVKCDMPTANDGSVTARNVVGGAGMTAVLLVTNRQDSGTVQAWQIAQNGATYTTKNDANSGATQTGRVMSFSW